jgi:hypothetical protein
MKEKYTSLEPVFGAHCPVKKSIKHILKQVQDDEIMT